MMIFIFPVCQKNPLWYDTKCTNHFHESNSLTAMPKATIAFLILIDRVLASCVEGGLNQMGRI